jgi:hypothetical protein
MEVAAVTVAATFVNMGFSRLGIPQQHTAARASQLAHKTFCFAI